MEVGLNYQFGLTNAMDSGDGNTTHIVEYINGSNRVKNLALELDQVKRSGLKLTVGLMLKF